MMEVGQVHGALWQLCTVGSLSNSWFYTAKSKAFTFRTASCSSSVGGDVLTGSSTERTWGGAG